MIEFETHQSIERCIERIEENIDSRVGALYYSYGPLVGKVKDNRIWLIKRTYRRSNSFGRVFDGQFETQNGKTLLKGTFKLFLLIKMLLAVTIAFHTLIFGIMLYGVTQLENRETILTIGLPIWFFMTCGGILTAYIGHRMSLKEERHLLALLEELLGVESAKKV